MTAPTYFAMGGVIFVREHRPITLERAQAMRAIHLSNASRWLEQTHLSRGARLAMARIEQNLADEMDAAILAVTQPANDAAETEAAA